MFKLVMPVVFSSASIIIADGLTSKVLAKCNATNEGIYGSIASKIDDSKIADIRQLRCGDVIAINQSSPDSLLLTSGRKGVSTQSVCLMMHQIHVNMLSGSSMTIKIPRRCYLKYLA